MSIEETRSHRYIVARDLAERLLPDLSMNELLLWSPDLFAYTSYILSMTGAYQLVISPPKKEKWFPTNENIRKWLGIEISEDLSIKTEDIRLNLRKWLKTVIEEWKIEKYVSVWGKDAYGKHRVKEFKPEFDAKILEIVADIKTFLDKNIEINVKNTQNSITLSDYLIATIERMGEKQSIKTAYEKIKENAEEEISGNDVIPKEFHNVMNVKIKQETENKKLSEMLMLPDDSGWLRIVQEIGEEWAKKLSSISEADFNVINDENHEVDAKKRSLKLFDIMLERTPSLLLGCWAYFYNKVTDVDFYDDPNKPGELRISELLCNNEESVGEDLWLIAQSLITMHAISDIACERWGLHCISTEKNQIPANKRSQFFAEKLLFTKGSLSTINTERCRVMPKRHNPEIGITLRSISSNLAFHRSPVDVVWRQCYPNKLAKNLKGETVGKTVSILLLPFPLSIKTTDFKADKKNLVNLPEGYGFFEYSPPTNTPTDEIINVINKANAELVDRTVDMIVLPESSISKRHISGLEEELSNLNDPPSIYIAGVRETKSKENNFARNVVYCKCFNDDEKGYDTERSRGIEMYKQYKHHRWKLDSSQVKQYGLSQVMDYNTVWWESIKVPRRRVSFLNIGDSITICHLICEDLARQDPIADLIRHVGPSLVVTILMDGPQKADRWSSRYASVLSEDPGCSVITLTSFGMVRRCEVV